MSRLANRGRMSRANHQEADMKVKPMIIEKRIRVPTPIALEPVVYNCDSTDLELPVHL